MSEFSPAKGADGLIAVAAGAGGHAGTLSPFALLQEIRKWFEGPLLLSGSIASGGSILAAQAAGADLAYIGSPFIATFEAKAREEYKKMITESGAEDIVYTDFFTGINGNYLRGSIENAGMNPDDLPDEKSASVGLDGDVKAWKTIWGCGQGVGVIDEVCSVSSLIDRWEDEYRACRGSLRGDESPLKWGLGR